MTRMRSKEQLPCRSEFVCTIHKFNSTGFLLTDSQFLATLHCSHPDTGGNLAAKWISRKKGDSSFYCIRGASVSNLGVSLVGPRQGPGLELTVVFCLQSGAGLGVIYDWKCHYKYTYRLILPCGPDWWPGQTRSEDISLKLTPVLLINVLAQSLSVM